MLLKQMQLNHQQLHLCCGCLCTADCILNLHECHNVFLSCCRQLAVLMQRPVTGDKQLRAMDQTHCYPFSNIL